MERAGSAEVTIAADRVRQTRNAQWRRATRARSVPTAFAFPAVRQGQIAERGRSAETIIAAVLAPTMLIVRPIMAQAFCVLMEFAMMSNAMRSDTVLTVRHAIRIFIFAGTVVIMKNVEKEDFVIISIRISVFPESALSPWKRSYVKVIYATQRAMNV